MECIFSDPMLKPRLSIALSYNGWGRGRGGTEGEPSNIRLLFGKTDFDLTVALCPVCEENSACWSPVRNEHLSDSGVKALIHFLTHLAIRSITVGNQWSGSMKSS